MIFCLKIDIEMKNSYWLQYFNFLFSMDELNLLCYPINCFESVGYWLFFRVYSRFTVTLCLYQLTYIFLYDIDLAYFQKNNDYEIYKLIIYFWIINRHEIILKMYWKYFKIIFRVGAILNLVNKFFICIIKTKTSHQHQHRFNSRSSYFLF